MTPEDRIEMPESPPPPALNKDSRRRLLRGGLAATPALLTMVSRPVMAAQTCFAGSVSDSAAASRQAAGHTCSGLTVGSWERAPASEWPTPMASRGDTQAEIAEVATEAEAAAGAKKDKKESNDPFSVVVATTEAARRPKVPGTTFNSVFGNYRGYDNKTLFEVLSLNSNTGRDGLARHLVAAYLNALKGYTPAAVLDVVTTKNIWASFVSRGYYEPTAGIRWYPDHAEPANPRGGLIAWIKTTMPV